MGEHYFVGPDNGLLTQIIESVEGSGQSSAFICLEYPLFWLPKVSGTFHGCDIFAPVAAHLANDTSLIDLGRVVTDPVRMKLAGADRIPNGWIAHVTAIDVFGNLTTDLPVEALLGRTNVLFRLHGVEIGGMTASYGHKPPGMLVAVPDSADFVELAVVNGSAAGRLKAGVGDVVEITLRE